MDIPQVDFFFYLLAEVHMGHFQFLMMINKSALNIYNIVFWVFWGCEHKFFISLR